ncbi:MAG TPA: ferrous iron transporter B [Acidobacteriota bacterium]|nr:ferrous iron transporter B [Acidobacteriota bacterium]
MSGPSCHQDAPDAVLPVLNSQRRVALVGSPNSGKTTVFNALTGLRSKVANYAGVTVELAVGTLRGVDGTQVEIIDLPGTYSLDPHSPEERLTLNFLRGRLASEPQPDAVLFVADSTSLSRSLPLLGAVMELGLPVVLVLTMIDEIESRRGRVDPHKLERLLGIPVEPVVANRGRGIESLKQRLLSPRALYPPMPESPVPDDPAQRFAWGDEILRQAYRSPVAGTPFTDTLDRWMLHPVTGVITFLAVMLFFFQSIFSWAQPMMDGLDSAVGMLGGYLTTLLPAGMLRDILVDGVLTGVGSVIVFVPQIALLFLLLTFFEQVGYMSRAVFLVDRLMSWAGLDGRSFVSLLSGYACAIPGIMATRSIPDRRQRMATILVTPFMTCSARLPVYAVLIAAFVPSQTVAGFLNLQGLVMMGLYLAGALAALLAATWLRRGPLKGQSMPFFVELPPYRRPTARVLWRGVWMPVSSFLRRAGTIILAASILLWAMLTFPRVEVPAHVEAQGRQAYQAYQLEHSLAASTGKLLEPVFEPIGFDWRISVGIVASLAAREVIIATLAQIYSVEEEDETALVSTLRSRLAPPSVPPDQATGAQRLAVALSLLAFFIFALQCVSTLAVMRRETGNWRLPALAFGGMFVIAYCASWITYHATLWLAA